MCAATDTPWRVRTATLTLAIAASAAAAVAVLTPSAQGGTAPPGIPTAKQFAGVPTVGALFSTAGRKSHFCSASVVDSTAGDLLLTAAHCVYTRHQGYAKHIVFVPGYHVDGKYPYGTWTIKRITVAAGWRRSQNPDLDVAFLTVGARIQARTGGLRLGTGRGYQAAVEPAGYNDTDSAPVKCRTRSFKFRSRQLEFYCRNFWDGTSGGPWITGFNPRTGTGTVMGVIGGYEQGGDYNWSSYSPYFGSAVQSLFRKAGGRTPSVTTASRMSAQGRAHGQAQGPAKVPAKVPAKAPVKTPAKREKRRAWRQRAQVFGAELTAQVTRARALPPEPRRRRLRHITLVPYISPSGSASSSRRTPSGSRK